MKYVLPQEMTLLEALLHFFPDSSKRTYKQWVEFKRVTIDGALTTNLKDTWQKGQELCVHPKQKIEEAHGIPILYQDRYFIVIDKPAGLLSVASDNPQELNALQLLRHHFKTKSIFAVHRIDRDTSGILLFAKGVASEKAFDKLFAAHSLTRNYFAIVEGTLSQNHGTWRSYLLEKSNYDVVLSSKEAGGSLAVTHYKVVRRSKKFTYLQLELETGRKHQIRVHCQLAGHPIIGDERYGALLNPLHRLGLHAQLLEFIHPFTHKPMSFSSPIPAPFAKLGIK